MNDKALVEVKEKLNNLFSILILNAELAIEDIKSVDQTDDIKKIKYSVDQILKSIKDNMFIGDMLDGMFIDFKSKNNIYGELRKIQNKESLTLLNKGIREIRKEGKNAC